MKSSQNTESKVHKTPKISFLKSFFESLIAMIFPVYVYTF